MPRGIGYKSEQFGLVSLGDSCVGLRSKSPKTRQHVAMIWRTRIQRPNVFMDTFVVYCEVATMSAHVYYMQHVSLRRSMIQAVSGRPAIT
jgi:hypothetical protein